MSEYNDHGDAELARLYEELAYAQQEEDDAVHYSDELQARYDDASEDDEGYEDLEQEASDAYNEQVRCEWEVTNLWQEIYDRKEELGVTE